MVCTASGFMSAVDNNISEKSITTGDNSFIGDIYGRQAQGRNGFMMFSLSRKTDSAGYNVTVTHETGRPQQLAIAFMTARLAEIRMAKQSGLDLARAIQDTCTAAFASAKRPENRSNDPMLQQGNSTPEINQTRIVEQNTDPISTPPVSHVNPVSGAPTSSGFGGGAPFQTPNFGQWDGGNGGSNMPF